MEIDKLFIELQIKTLTEKIKEQERFFKYAKEADIREMINNRIIQLEVERDLYLRLL